MASHTFISYASQDAAVAQAACAALERRGLRCWMAPRDVPPGADYAEAIVSAIKASRNLVVIFSPQANSSPHVLREVERAVSYKVPVIPLRLDGALPSGSMEYLLSTPHWLEAGATPGDAAFESLAGALTGTSAPASRAGAPRPTGLLGVALLQSVLAVGLIITGLVMFNLSFVAPASAHDAAFILVLHAPLAIVLGVGLTASVAGLLLRRKWARNLSLLLNVANVPFQMLYKAAAMDVVKGASHAPGAELLGVALSLLLVVYLFQPGVGRYFSASTA